MIHMKYQVLFSLKKKKKKMKMSSAIILHGTLMGNFTLFIFQIAAVVFAVLISSDLRRKKGKIMPDD